MLMHRSLPTTVGDGCVGAGGSSAMCVISVLSQKAQAQNLGVTTSLGLWFCKAEILSLPLLETADLLRARCES